MHKSKKCSRCGQEKPVSEFHKSPNSADRLVHKCKPCCSEYMKEYAAKNKARLQEQGRAYYQKNRKERIRKNREWAVKNKDRVKDNFLRYRFGETMNHKRYLELLELQSGVCAICGQDERSARYKSLAVDHDHNTGEVRGLLCSHCNRALGFFQDDPEILRRATEYLEHGYIHGPMFSVTQYPE